MIDINLAPEHLGYFRMMKKFIVLKSLFLPILGFGQFSINATGNHTSTTNYALSYSIGEIGTLTIQNATKNLYATGGVIQPDPVILIYTEEFDRQFIQLYPNPAGEWVHLKLGAQTSLAYQIINGHGQVLLVGEWHGEPINVQELQEGLYILKGTFARTNHSFAIKFFKS